MKPDSTFRYETPEESPGLLLWQNTILWQRAIKVELDPHHVTHTQFVLLANLLFLEESKVIATQSLLSNLSKLDKMTISKSLKQLQLTKFITREEHPQDTRAKAVKLTSEGQKLVKLLIPKVESCDERYFSKLSSTERRQFLKLMSKLTTTIKP